MTKYLVQKFFWLREKSLIQISQKTLVSLFPFFPIFRNHSGDRSIGLLPIEAISISSFRWIAGCHGIKLLVKSLSIFPTFLGGLAGPLADPPSLENTQLSTMVEVQDSRCDSSFSQSNSGVSELLVGPLNEGQVTRIHLSATTNIVLAIF